MDTEACNSVTVPDKSCQASFVYPHPPPTTAQDYLRYVEGKFVFSSPMACKKPYLAWQGESFELVIENFTYLYMNHFTYLYMNH